MKRISGQIEIFLDGRSLVMLVENMQIFAIFRFLILEKLQSNGSNFMPQLLMEVTHTCFVSRRSILVTQI
ncbi:hypothetical protein ACS0TY_016742 [Phlomoides rotata]